MISSKEVFERAKQKVIKKYPDTNLDMNNRWENGIEHHPKSIALMGKLAEIDFHLCDDYFCWKTGGDGDNGEILMYMLDVIFESEANEKTRNK